MPILPAPFRAYIGLVATAVETAQGLIQRAPELPVEAVGNTMQLSMKVQQRYQELVARGDELLGHLIGPPAHPPGWATFDEDESGSDAYSGGAKTGNSAAATTVSADDLDYDDDALSASAPAAFFVDSAGETTVDASAAAVFDDESTDGGLSDDPSAAAVFDDDPVSASAFTDEVGPSPTVTHGDPLLAETPVLTLPAKKPVRRSTAAARRRLPAVPTVPPAGEDSATDSAASHSADLPTSVASLNAMSAGADQLTGPGNPAPANIDTMEAIPVEAVMAELADATPAAPVPPVRKTAAGRSTPARRSPRSRPRPAGASADDESSPVGAKPGAVQPPTADPAVQQPAEPTAAASDSDAAPMS